MSPCSAVYSSSESLFFCVQESSLLVQLDAIATHPHSTAYNKHAELTGWCGFFIQESRQANHSFSGCLSFVYSFTAPSGQSLELYKDMANLCGFRHWDLIPSHPAPPQLWLSLIILYSAVSSLSSKPPCWALAFSESAFRTKPDPISDGVWYTMNSQMQRQAERKKSHLAPRSVIHPLFCFILH